MRSSWTDPDAAFVGIKCGKNGIAHAHQDLGSFIFYALGEKWLIDLGTEHQTYLTHQHGLPRTEFYRIREEGHNTLVFDPGPKFSQGTKASSTIERFETSPGDVFAIADLTDAYDKHATSAKRGYRLFANRTALLVQDEFTARQNSDVWWFAHGTKGTDYSLDDSGKIVTLRRGKKLCRAHLLAPADAKLQVIDAKPLPTSPNPDIQEPNEGMKKLALHLPNTKQATIAVLFVPQPTEATPADLNKTISPLQDWHLPKN